MSTAEENHAYVRQCFHIAPVKRGYLYGLVDPTNGYVFYVGITDKPRTRLSAHLHSGRKNKGRDKERYIGYLRTARKTDPVMAILAVCANTSVADRLETKTVKAHYQSLVNLNKSYNFGWGAAVERGYYFGKPRNDVEWYATEMPHKRRARPDILYDFHQRDWRALTVVLGESVPELEHFAETAIYLRKATVINSRGAIIRYYWEHLCRSNRVSRMDMDVKMPVYTGKNTRK